jgi:hypothetical protein
MILRDYRAAHPLQSNISLAQPRPREPPPIHQQAFHPEILTNVLFVHLTERSCGRRVRSLYGRIATSPIVPSQEYRACAEHARLVFQ